MGAGDGVAASLLARASLLAVGSRSRRAVRYEFESDAAHDDVSSPYGVYGVTNEIELMGHLFLGRTACRSPVAGVKLGYASGFF